MKTSDTDESGRVVLFSSMRVERFTLKKGDYREGEGVDRNLEQEKQLFSSLPPGDPRRMKLRRSILHGLMAADPKSAIKWASELPERVERARAFATIERLFSGSSDHDLIDAIESTDNVELQHRLLRMYSSTTQTIQQDFAKLEALQSSRPELLKLADMDIVRGGIVHRWVSKEPKATAWALVDHLQSDRDVKTIVNRLGQHDPSECSKWISALKDEQYQETAAIALISQRMAACSNLEEVELYLSEQDTKLLLDLSKLRRIEKFGVEVFNREK